MASLENCLTHMLNGAVNHNNPSFDLAAMIQECAPGPINKHYEFLGQGAIYLAVTTCLRQQFGQYNDDILQQMLALLTRNRPFSRAFAYYYGFHQIKINTLLPETVAERIVGIIQDMCGSQVVLATVTPVLSEHGPELLSKLPRPLRRTMGLLNKENNIGTPLGNGNNIACVPPFDAPMPQQQCHQQQSQSQPQQTPQPSSPRRPIAISRSLSFSQSSVNPYNEFLLMTKQGNGASHISFEEKRNDIGNVILEWGCRVTFQMTKSSAWRTHHRFGQTKKKAKFLVLHDINNYYKKYPEQALQDKLIVPDVGQPENALDLPIDPSDYCHDTVQQKQQESSPATPELPTYWYSPFPGLSDTQAIHIPDKRNRTMEEEDEYAQHMMNVLLGDFPKISLEHDGLSKRHKKMTVSTMETTTEYTTTTTMMDSDDIMTPPSSAASLLPDTIHPPNNSAESVTDLGAIRKMVDVSRLDKMINDPVQAANPKSSLFSYIHNIKGLEVKSEFEENGPAHQKIFETTTSVFGGGYTVSGRGMGLKKSDSEQMAILNLMKKIVGVA